MADTATIREIQAQLVKDLAHLSGSLDMSLGTFVLQQAQDLRKDIDAKVEKALADFNAKAAELATKRASGPFPGLLDRQERANKESLDRLLSFYEEAYQNFRRSYAKYLE